MKIINVSANNKNAQYASVFFFVLDEMNIYHQLAYCQGIEPPIKKEYYKPVTETQSRLFWNNNNNNNNNKQLNNINQ